jgi:hypothetical protein
MRERERDTQPALAPELNKIWDHKAVGAQLPPSLTFQTLIQWKMDPAGYTSAPTHLVLGPNRLLGWVVLEGMPSPTCPD